MKNIVHVVRSLQGWWDVRNHRGQVVVRFVSELQAVEAGRMEADRVGADLLVQPHETPTRYEVRDPATGQLHPAPHAARTAHGTPEHDTDPGLILFVEDSTEAREFYAAYLTCAGFRVVTATNGSEALRLAAQFRPDLILMDVRMPGMDGLEATAKMKADPDLSHIPVVALSAHLSADVIARAIDAGCIATLPKSALPEEVAQRIAELLQVRVAGRSA